MRISPKLSYLCGKDCHRLYVIINTDKKIRKIKISPMSARGENFSPVLATTYGIQ